MRIGVLGGARNLADNRANRRKGVAGKKVATEGSSSNPGGDTWYWRLVEFGASTVAAHPFMRPALANNVERVTDTIATELSNELDKLIPG
jgi:HK97 gp10 family phage protein